jgi:hypothetical protein
MKHGPTVNRTTGRMAAIRATPARLVATALAAAAAVALVIGTIGPPIVGNGVFLTSDLIYIAFPWQAEADPVTELQAHLGGPTTDTIDVVYPSRAVFGQQARDGNFAAWNPYNFGGEPLGATSNFGQLNPLVWPFVFLPGWLAPAMVKLAGMATALAFTYLFSRRLGTDRVPAVLGAVVFAGSGFIVMWNNWPQADVASLIPVLFWATERFLQKRTVSSAIPIALALACLLLGQFPAIVGYTLTVLAGYVLVRLLCGARAPEQGWAVWRRRSAEAPDAPDARAEGVTPPSVEGGGPAEGGEVVEAAGPAEGGEVIEAAGPAKGGEVADGAEAHVRDRLSVLQTVVAGVGAGAALLAGVLLVAVILLPFGARLSSSALDREQNPDANLRAATLVTAAAPSAFGISDKGVNFNGPARNQIESVSYVGVVGLLLAVAAVALPRTRRAPRGAVAGLAVTTVVMGIATFGGGPILELLQRFPVYDTNFIGRTRSILGLTVAALAAVGLQALIERSRAEGGRRWHPLDVVRLVAVAAVTVGVSAYVYNAGWDWASSHDRANAFAESMPQVRVIGIITLVAIALLLVGRGPGRQVLAAGLVILATVQGLMFAAPLLPNESRDTLYPTTPGLAFLRDNAGGERVVPDGYTLFANATMLEGIRSVTGHGFHAPTWKDMLSVASPGAFSRSPTLGYLSGDPLYVQSPIFDRLGARWFAGTPASEPFGTRETLTLDRADCTRIADSDIVTTYADMSYGLWGVPEPEAGAPAPTPPGAEAGGDLVVAPVAPSAGTAPGADSLAGNIPTGPLGPAGITPEGNVIARMRVPGKNGLNGVVVRLCSPTQIPQGTSFHVSAVAGDVTATGILPVRGDVPSRDFALPVAGGDLAGDAPIDVTVTLVSPSGQGLFLAAGPGGGVSADLIRPSDDGLRLAFAGDLRIYERTNALPRIRWAARSEVISDGGERVQFIGSGSVPDDTVILSEGAAGGSGQPADVEVLEDSEVIEVSVDAEGDGYLVIADGIQHDWVATLDGEEVDLVEADHAGVAVPVPAGEHTIEVRYQPRGQKAGAVISGVTAFGLAAAGLVSLGLQWRRRRRAGAAEAAPAEGTSPEADDDAAGAGTGVGTGEDGAGTTTPATTPTTTPTTPEPSPADPPGSPVPVGGDGRRPEPGPWAAPASDLPPPTVPPAPPVPPFEPPAAPGPSDGDAEQPHRPAHFAKPEPEPQAEPQPPGEDAALPTNGNGNGNGTSPNGSAARRNPDETTGPGA